MLSIITGDEYKQDYPVANLLTGVAFIVDAYKKNPQIKIFSNMNIKEIEYVSINSITLKDMEGIIGSFILLDCSKKIHTWIDYLVLQHNRRRLSMYLCYPNLHETPYKARVLAETYYFCEYRGDNIKIMKKVIPTDKPPTEFEFNATQYLKYYTENKVIIPSYHLVNLHLSYKKLMSAIQKWQHSELNRFCSILSNFCIAFRTYYRTIISSLAGFLHWCEWNSEPILAFDNGLNSYTTFSTYKTAIDTITLSPQSLIICPSTKINHNTSFWKSDNLGGYRLYINDEWTGILVTTISEIWVNLGVPSSIISLIHPVFCIMFCPLQDTSKIHPLVDMPTLKEAKELAESYYKKWLNVN